MAEPVLDIVTEYPQVPHVPDQMEPAAMQEHGRNEGYQDGAERQVAFRPAGDERRHNAVAGDEGLQSEAQRELVKEDGDVGQDYKNGNEWK